MEVIDVVIDEALNDKEIKRLLTQAKFKTNTHVTYNNNANINNNDDIANLSISSSPQSSSPLVLPQYSNSEPLDLIEKKTKKTKSHINRSRRHNDDYGDEDNDFSKTHSVDKYGRFSSYNNSNNDIDEIDNIINSNNISTASTNDWSRPLVHSFKQQQDYSNDFDEYNEDNINNRSLNDTSFSSNNQPQRHVKFDNNLVSQVFTRDKCTREETVELFYTHEEANKFTVDYNRECYRAQIEGMSWYDWWQNRETDISDDNDLEISDDFIVEDIDEDEYEN
jgi:hypothetical protein